MKLVKEFDLQGFFSANSNDFNILDQKIEIKGDELYNISDDPSESNNLIQSHKKVADILRRKLSSLISSKDKDAYSTLTQEVKKELFKLGYLKKNEL